MIYKVDILSRQKCLKMSLLLPHNYIHYTECSKNILCVLGTFKTQVILKLFSFDSILKRIDLYLGIKISFCILCTCTSHFLNEVAATFEGKFLLDFAKLFLWGKIQREFSFHLPDWTKQTMKIVSAKYCETWWWMICNYAK